MIRRIMKTLHKMFHKRLLKIFLFSLVSSIVTSFSLILITEHEVISKIQIVGLGMFILTLLMMTVPLTPIFMDNHFFLCLKSLINQGFSRKELLKFSAFTVGLRSLMTLLVYASIHQTLYHFTSDPKFIKFLSFEIPYFTYDMLLYTLIAISLGISFHMFIFLAKSRYKENLKEQQSSEMNKKFFGSVVIGGSILLLLELNDLPTIIGLILFSMFFIWGFLNSINRNFKLYHPENFAKRSAYFSPLFALPFVLILVLINFQTQDKSIPHKHRISSVLTLGNLKSDYINSDRLQFLKEASKSDFSELLPILGKTLKVRELIEVAETSEKLIELQYYISKRKLTQNEISEYIESIQQLKEAKKLTFNYDSKFLYFFSKAKVDQKYANELLNSNSSLKQFAGLILSFKNLQQEEYKEFLISNKEKLDQNVINHSYIKRKIASVEKKEDPQD